MLSLFNFRRSREVLHTGIRPGKVIKSLFCHDGKTIKKSAFFCSPSLFAPFNI
jgi:hypothetical protein